MLHEIEGIGLRYGVSDDDVREFITEVAEVVYRYMRVDLVEDYHGKIARIGL